jgi:malonyl CoA-acyl carrier protein transacylase
MSSRTVPLRQAPPLPEKIEDWERHIKAERTLNDLVEDIHRVLVDQDEKYRAYLRAVYDAHAVEGSLAADNVLAAMIIREKAKEIGSTEVAQEKLAIINLALGVVLRRYHASRKQRRNMVAGEEVPADNNGE